MVVVGGGWVVLSLPSPLLYGCCRRGLGCIKFSHLCCMVVVGGDWVVLSLHSPLLYGCCRRGLGCIKSSLASAVWLL